MSAQPWTRTQLTALALALISVDATLVILDMLAQLQDWRDPRWSIEHDGGYAEWWQYGKEAAACLLLLMLWRGAHGVPRSACLAWAGLFAWFLIDDAAQLHEQLGWRLFPEAAAVGELVFMLLVGCGLLLAIALSSVGGGKRWRWWSQRLLAGVVVFALFAVGVDLLHALVSSPFWHPVLGLFEDAGEMLGMSLCLLIVRALWEAHYRRS